ncbi:MAG TPA: PAS domain S-box protein [Kofleriaceae bacterium]|nr:PAS domain S-box protein [Kofleriaceae bacterium]
MPSDDRGATRSADELLRVLVDKISAMVAYWDSTQRCRFANGAFERWFGVSPEYLIGKHISELLGPLYPLSLPYIERVLRGERQEFEREVPDPAGGLPRYSLVNYIPDIVDGVARGFFGFITDISEIKRFQLALEESEARFSRAIDEAPIGMALVALDGRFVRVNRVLCEIVGYTPDELTGLTFQAITHPDDLDASLALTRRFVRGEIPRYQLAKRYFRKDGSIVDVMLSASMVRGRDGAPLHYVAQIEDITERKRLEDKLRLAEARSSGILAISADAIISVDEDQRITMFNEGAERIFGYARAEIIGAPLDLLMPEAVRAVHRRHVEDFANGKDAARRVGEHGRAVFGLRKSGELFPADSTISKLEVGGRRVLTVALRDMTEQKRIENEQRFLAEVGPVLATSLDYEETLTRIAELAVRDLADLCIIDVVGDDEEVRRFKVASRDPSKAWICEVLTQPPPDRRHPHLLQSVLETRQPVLLQGPSSEMIASLAQSEGHLRALRAAEIRSVVAVPLVIHARVLGAIAFVSSMASRGYGAADLRLAEELARRAALSIENARLYREARRATQVRDDVLGIVAHDLRNPLNGILLYANLLRSHPAECQRRSPDAAEAIERAATRMSRLIEDLLDVTRMESGRLSVEQARVAAAQLVCDAVASQTPLATAASLELRLDVAADLPDLWADRDRLLQVFENLIGNALKFTRPGGVITVGATPREGEVLFWVADTGSGIAAEELLYVFDRFWQARKGRRLGAGLGLPIVKGVIEAHRGHVWVQSTKGRGSTFFFTIPTARPAP